MEEDQKPARRPERDQKKDLKKTEKRPEEGWKKTGRSLEEEHSENQKIGDDISYYSQFFSMQ